MSQLIITKEIEKAREFMNDETKNRIEYLMYRINDEYDYEGRKPYTQAYKDLFSKLGETTVEGSGRRFVIKTKLNDFQYLKVIVNPASYKWEMHQITKKIIL